MGITGLLPALRPVTRDVHLKELSGLRVGVDTYCWLHKAVYTCPEELCTGVPTEKHIKFALSRLDMLLHFGLKPYLVFDGDYLPAKGGKEKERAEKREESRKRAEQCLREGDTAGARAHFIKAVDVTPAMAAQFIAAARSRGGARFVVAPYEADAQLGYLCRSGQIDLVITEDSDLLLFGCTRVLFKLGKDAAGQQVTLHEVFTERNDELDFRRCASGSSGGGSSISGGNSGSDGDECGGGGSDGNGIGGGGGSSAAAEDALLLTCALSGCDYLPSVLGIGLKRAHR
ncbi:PIN domain-like protein [Tribonema minus]|uniref:PIN domain-like protein n=1 Tax=Tribonema minus TaxID=303371 RepID=A0A835Z506_9STRA|nr:PIN domain-like protein [Tribonema minus]